jgi:hypothetical protein
VSPVHRDARKRVETAPSLADGSWSVVPNRFGTGDPADHPIHSIAAQFEVGPVFSERACSA